MRINYDSYETKPRFGSALVVHPWSEVLGKDSAWSAGGKFPFVFRCLTANFIGHSSGGYIGSLRISGIVLSENWEKSLFQKDTDANVIMLSIP